STKSAESTKSAQNAKSAKSTKSEKSTKSAESAESTKSVKSTKSAESAEKAECRTKSAQEKFAKSEYKNFLKHDGINLKHKNCMHEKGTENSATESRCDADIAVGAKAAAKVDPPR